MRGVDQVMEYHVVAQDGCWAAIPGGPAVRLSGGDIVMFAHRDAHAVSSAQGVRGDPPSLRGFGESAMERLPIRAAYDGSNAPSISPSGIEGETTIICAFLGCDLQPFKPLIASLPATSRSWLAGMRDHLVGRAIALLHEQPAQNWTIDEPGRHVDLSRSTMPRSPVHRRSGR
jgi:hypothetical protein